jgi:hypothetical protein
MGGILRHGIAWASQVSWRRNRTLDGHYGEKRYLGGTSFDPKAITG